MSDRYPFEQLVEDVFAELPPLSWTAYVPDRHDPKLPRVSQLAHEAGCGMCGEPLLAGDLVGWVEAAGRGHAICLTHHPRPDLAVEAVRRWRDGAAR